jgi:hypothetical protein
MKIKDLPNDLRELALDNQYKQNGECDKNICISYAFDWEKTPEGFDFWNDVYDGNIPTIENGNPETWDIFKTFYDEFNQTNKEEKPTQYKIGIDTFERAKANLTKEELLACCRFNIDKYTWRKKDQDKSDFEKIIAYATYAIENGF